MCDIFIHLSSLSPFFFFLGACFNGPFLSADDCGGCCGGCFYTLLVDNDVAFVDFGYYFLGSCVLGLVAKGGG